MFYFRYRVLNPCLGLWKPPEVTFEKKKRYKLLRAVTISGKIEILGKKIVAVLKRTNGPSKAASPPFKDLGKKTTFRDLLLIKFVSEMTWFFFSPLFLGGVFPFSGHDPVFVDVVVAAFVVVVVAVIVVVVVVGASRGCFWKAQSTIMTEEVRFWSPFWIRAWRILTSALPMSKFFNDPFPIIKSEL